VAAEPHYSDPLWFPPRVGPARPSRREVQWRGTGFLCELVRTGSFSEAQATSAVTVRMLCETLDHPQARSVLRALL
jgi:hypothetical protein